MMSADGGGGGGVGRRKLTGWWDLLKAVQGTVVDPGQPRWVLSVRQNDSMSQRAGDNLVLVWGIRDLVEMQWTFLKNSIFLEDEEVENSFQLKVFLKQ